MDQSDQTQSGIRAFISKNRLFFFLLLMLTLLKLAVIRRIGNKSWEPDDYWHVLHANTLFVEFPKYFQLGIDIWAKPLYTYFFGFVSVLARNGSLFVYQATNAVLWAVVCSIVYYLVKKITNNTLFSLLSGLLTGVGFIAFRSSITALTEPIFTVVLLLNLYYLYKEKYVWATFWISLLPLGRMEGFLFLGLHNLYLLFLAGRKKISFKKLLVLWIASVVPTLIWNFIGYRITGDPLYLAQRGYPKTPGLYGYGHIRHFVQGFWDQDTFTLIYFAIGSLFCVSYFPKVHRVVKLALVYTSMLFIFDTYLWHKGLFGTAGLMRYMVPIVPLMCIIGGVGFNFVHDAYRDLKTDKKRNQLFVAMILIGVQLLLTLQLIHNKQPYKNLWNYPNVPNEEIQAGEWIKGQNVTCKVVSWQPDVLYYAGLDMSKGTVYFDSMLETDPFDEIIVVNKEWLKGHKITDINKISNTRLLQEFNMVDIFLHDSPTDSGNCGLKQ